MEFASSLLFQKETVSRKKLMLLDARGCHCLFSLEHLKQETKKEMVVLLQEFPLILHLCDDSPSNLVFPANKIIPHDVGEWGE